jgi:hypothetical protein
MQAHPFHASDRKVNRCSFATPAVGGGELRAPAALPWGKKLAKRLPGLLWRR